jgi:hypothetical protein
LRKLTRHGLRSINGQIFAGDDHRQFVGKSVDAGVHVTGKGAAILSRLGNNLSLQILHTNTFGCIGFQPGVTIKIPGKTLVRQQSETKRGRWGDPATKE